MPNPSLGRRCDKTFSFNFKAFFCGLSSYKYYFFSCSKKERTSELIWKKSIEGRVFACLRNKRIVSGSPHPQDSLKHSLVIDREPGPGVRVWVAARANTHCRRHTSSRHCRQITEYSTVQYSTVQYSTVQYSTVQYSTGIVAITSAPSLQTNHRGEEWGGRGGGAAGITALQF